MELSCLEDCAIIITIVWWWSADSAVLYASSSLSEEESNEEGVVWGRMRRASGAPREFALDFLLTVVFVDVARGNWREGVVEWSKRPLVVDDFANPGRVPFRVNFLREPESVVFPVIPCLSRRDRSFNNRFARNSFLAFRRNFTNRWGTPRSFLSRLLSFKTALSKTIDWISVTQR